MSWHASLQLDYQNDAGRSVARFRHEGPLRILRSLYPEGDRICHNVLVHPPGGLVDGDVLDVHVHAAGGAHGLVTTPGATRFYRCEQGTALQQVRLELAPGARLEWLPLEALYYSGCQAENHLTMALGEGAELMGWDVTALGLPAAGQPFMRGQLVQHLELEGAWREHARIDALDQRLLHGPLGLAGQACMATLFLAAGTALARPRRELAIDAAQALLPAGGAQVCAGVTAPGPQVVVLRVLAPQVEPAMALLRQVWAAWRVALWSLPAPALRGWAV